jgi:cell division protein FtsN
MRKKLLIPTLGLAALIGTGIVGTSIVKADSFNPNSPIVQKLVERFGLNEDEVVSTFEELRTEHQEMIRRTKEEKLNQAVNDGVITEEQKQALLAKWEEMKAEKEQHREEMENWFDEQGIDREALMQYGGFGRGGLGKMGRMRIK